MRLGPHQGIVFDVGVAIAGSGVAAGMIHAESVAELMSQNLFRPPAEIDPALEAVVGHDVGTLDGDEGSAGEGMAGVRIEPGPTYGQHTARAAGERFVEFASTFEIVPEHGVDAVEVSETRGGGGGATVAVTDIGDGFVVPGVDGGLQIIETAAGAAGLTGLVREKGHVLTGVESAPAHVEAVAVQECVPLLDRLRQGELGVIVGRAGIAARTVGEPAAELLEFARPFAFEGATGDFELFGLTEIANGIGTSLVFDHPERTLQDVQDTVAAVGGLLQEKQDPIVFGKTRGAKNFEFVTVGGAAAMDPHNHRAAGQIAPHDP